jgi:hypothetical protein
MGIYDQPTFISIPIFNLLTYSTFVFYELSLSSSPVLGYTNHKLSNFQKRSIGGGRGQLVATIAVLFIATRLSISMIPPQLLETPTRVIKPFLRAGSD